MTRFTYIGDPLDRKGPPESVDLYGYHFPKHKGVEVEEDAVIAKLDGNSHFKRTQGRPPADTQEQDAQEGNGNGDDNQGDAQE